MSPSRSVKPTAVLIRSGDTVVLSGKLRLAVHAVPRILKDTSPEFLWHPGCLAEEDRALHYVLRDRRINISLRQVLPPGGSLAAASPATATDPARGEP